MIPSLSSLLQEIILLGKLNLIIFLITKIWLGFFMVQLLLHRKQLKILLFLLLRFQIQNMKHGIKRIRCFIPGSFLLFQKRYFLMLLGYLHLMKYGRLSLKPLVQFLKTNSCNCTLNSKNWRKTISVSAYLQRAKALADELNAAGHPLAPAEFNAIIYRSIGSDYHVIFHYLKSSF